MNTEHGDQAAHSGISDQVSSQRLNSHSVIQLNPIGQSFHGSGVPIKDSDQIVEDYDFLQIIGQGAFGTVFKASCKRSNRVVAIKYMKSCYQADREAEMLCKIPKHPNIIQLIEIYRSSDATFLVQEYCPQSLPEITSKLTPSDVASLILQLSSVLESLHAHNIIHRDLKPENIMVTRDGEKWQAKVIDFGLATELAHINTHCRPAGTDLFMAPEMIRGTYDSKADMWSLGITCCLLMSGELPVSSSVESRKLYEQILRLDCQRLKFKPVFEKKFCDLIRSLLDQDPGARPTACALRTQLATCNK